MSPFFKNHFPHFEDRHFNSWKTQKAVLHEVAKAIKIEAEFRWKPTPERSSDFYVGQVIEEILKETDPKRDFEGRVFETPG